MLPRLPKGFTHPVAIGRGSFASVYRAKQAGPDRWVAIKIIFEKNGAKRRELLHEAEVQAKMEIEGIPYVYDAFEWRSHVCIVMQWIKGVPLSSLLETPLTRDERRNLALRFSETLARLHERGFAHRDIKPANVLVAPAGGLFLVDFGFTKNTADSQRSLVSVAKGTPAYMAPEIWEQGSRVDLMRADVYSAGKVLAQILGDDDASQYFADCIEEKPEMRPASGMEILKRWNENPELSGVPREAWPRGISSLASLQLSEKLTASAKQLLLAGRSQEAYWLLVEALEDNPDSGDAVKLMSDFSHLSRSRAVAARYRWIAAAAAVLIISITAFYLGRQTGAPLPAKPVNLAPGKGSGLLSETRRVGSTLFSTSPLREDIRTADRLSGRLVVVAVPAEGTLRLDGDDVPRSETLQAGLAVAYGNHILAWYDRTGVQRWRERFFMLPFQTKAIPVVPSQRDTP